MNKIITLLISTILITGCGDKKVTLDDIQNGVDHVNNVLNSKNASEALANVAHVASDVKGLKPTASASK